MTQLFYREWLPMNDQKRSWETEKCSIELNNSNDKWTLNDNQETQNLKRKGKDLKLKIEWEKEKIGQTQNKIKENEQLLKKLNIEIEDFDQVLTKFYWKLKKYEKSLNIKRPY